MQQESRVLYRSANGDTWSLVRDSGPGKVAVLHQPNAASGGRPSRIGVGDFLTRDANGPQHAELLGLIATLVGEPDTPDKSVEPGGSPI